MKDAVIRSADFTDEYAVHQLCVRNNLELDEYKETWDHLWNRNKYYTQDWEIGWVVEDSNKVVGFIGNIPRAYTFKDKIWVAGVARAFVVDEKYRKYSLQLIARFIKQNKSDVLIFSSANSEAGKVYELMHAEKMPQKEYEKDLFWIISPFNFLVSFFLKRNISAVFGYVLSLVFAPFLSLISIYRRFLIVLKIKIKIKIKKQKIDNILVDNLPDEFDIFWNKLRDSNSDKFLAMRSATDIQWQFSKSISVEKKPRIFIVWEDREIKGYAIVTRQDSKKFKLERLMINDLMVINDRLDLVHSLINKILFYAKSEKVSVVQIVGLPSFIRDKINLLKPFVRKVPYHRFWYYPKNIKLSYDLHLEESWYASTYDGDSSL